MATASRGLAALRGAIEVTEGAGTAPTRLLYLPADSVSLEHKVEQSEDSRGWAKFDATADIYPEIQDIAFVVSNAPVAYEDWGWWLTAFAASGGETPSTVDTSAYLRGFDPSQTDSAFSATGVRSLNLEYSANDFAGTRVWKMPGMIGEELTVDFRKRASGGDTGITWSGRFRSASKPSFATSFTGALSDTSRTLALGQQLSAYLDSSTANLGNTAAADIKEAQFHFLRQAMFHDGMDGSDGHTSMHRPEQWTSEFSYVRKFSDIAQYDDYIGSAFAKAAKAVRIEAIGAIVGGTTATNIVRCDFFGKYVDNSSVGGTTSDGMWHEEFKLRGLHDATQGASWSIATQNSVATAYKTA